MTAPIPVVFSAGISGRWRIVRVEQIAGPVLEHAARLDVREGASEIPPGPHVWSLRGVTSHSRYVNRAERTALLAAQAPLDRKEATRAALIPIRKASRWWDLEQDERRSIFEERSRHIAASMRYLPAIARRLYHARELGEPFDFLTWFEFSAEHESAFDDLLTMLRATEEWNYVEREIDIRLARAIE